MNKNMELMIINEGYSVNLNLRNDMQDELAGLDGGFDCIKIPAGGGTSFEVPNLENSDEPVNVKEFSAVILHHHSLFTYYENKYTGSSNPPDCCSFDGINGTGTPGGKCRFCKLNAFGSGENGSKACKNKHRLYLLRENEIFPMVLVLPTSSIQEFSKYIKIQTLYNEGIRTACFISPIFPGITDVITIIDRVKNQCQLVWLENLNLRGSYKAVIMDYIRDKHPKLVPLYEDIYSRGNRLYWEKLDGSIKDYISKNGLKYVRYDDSVKKEFDEPPTVVNYFYHEEIKKSAKKRR